MRFIGLSVLALSLFSMAAMACSSAGTSTTGTGGPAQDKGLEGNGTTAPPPGKETNPDGKAYPTDNIGTKPSTHNVSKKTEGTPGNRIKNFKFYGFPRGDKSQGLQQVSLADYYDPSVSKVRLIHIQAAAVWCGPCNQEAKAAASINAKFDEKKVVWIAALVESARQGSPASQSDLEKWLTSYPSNFTHVIDPLNTNLGVFFDAAAIPWNAEIDARTMEILDAGTGGAGTADGVMASIEPWLSFLATYSPAGK